MAIEPIEKHGYIKPSTEYLNENSNIAISHLLPRRDT
jgi:hypothetical protein